MIHDGFTFELQVKTFRPDLVSAQVFLELIHRFFDGCWRLYFCVEVQVERPADGVGCDDAAFIAVGQNGEREILFGDEEIGLLSCVAPP